MLSSKYLSTSYFWLFLLMVCVHQKAAAKQIIAVAELSGLFQHAANNQHQGVYHALLTKALADTKLSDQYIIEVMPMKRAKLEFLKQTVACYAPGEDTFDGSEGMALPKNILHSTPFNKALIKVVSNNPKRVISNVGQINNSDIISIVRGVPSSRELDRIKEKAKIVIEVNSEMESLQLLLLGRVDLILAFYPDINFAYKELNIHPHLPYSNNYSPVSINDNIICHPSYKKDFEKINKKITEYLQNGEIEILLNDYFIH